MGPLRIVLVEDDALIGALLGELLADMGHNVLEITTTESGAVAAAARHQPDLMIVDAHLREGNGPSAIDAILRIGPLPHLFISGATAYLDRPGAVTLQKPFRERELARAIERALDPGPAAATAGVSGTG